MNACMYVYLGVSIHVCNTIRRNLIYIGGIFVDLSWKISMTVWWTMVAPNDDNVEPNCIGFEYLFLLFDKAQF